jgi:hypothetical protein
VPAAAESATAMVEKATILIDGKNVDLSVEVWK